MAQTQISVVSAQSAQFLGTATVTAESGKLGGYAAYTAAFARTGGFEVYGYASKQVTPIAAYIAKERAGDSWASLELTQQMRLANLAENTAKRYAEKAVSICKAIADNATLGLDITQLRAAESDADAAAIVRAFFSSKSIYSQDLLFEFFGFASTQKKPREKSEEKAEPQAAPAPAPEAAPAPAPEFGSSDELMDLVRAALSGLTEEERAKFAVAVTAEVKAYLPAKAPRAKAAKETATA
jgi:hypothetical protein